MQNGPLESKECAVLRETLRSLDVSIQRNTELLNECWSKPPISDKDEILKEESKDVVCQPDKSKSEKWYRNIIKQLRGGRNVEAVFRQLLIVCQSYGFSLPPPPSKDATLRPTLNMQQENLEVHELISQIYTRLAKHYCETLQTVTNHYDVVQTLTALSYVLSPTLMLAQFHSVRLNQLNAQLPTVTASSDLMVFFNRIKSLLSLTKEHIIMDMGVFLMGIFGQITEPNKIIRIVYLDRLTKELLAYLQQLKGTNQLGTYFCDIAAACYDLEQSVEYFVDKFAGLSLLEVVNTEGEAETPELLWNWRVKVFSPYVEVYSEKIAVEKQELLAYLAEIPPDFWHSTSCQGECIFECKKYNCDIALGVHSVICRLVKYTSVIKHLGDIADIIAPQVSEDTDSSSSAESLSDAVDCLINEVVAAILLLADRLSEKVPDSRPIGDLYVCYSTLHVLESLPSLPLSPATRTVLLETSNQILEQVVFVNNDTIEEWIMFEENSMCWSRNHTIEIKECNASVISLNLHLRHLYHDLQQTLPAAAQHRVMVEVLEHSLTFLTNRYLAAKPSKANSKLFLYDVTAIVMMYSTFVWVLTGSDVTQITEPREGALMVIYSNLNRLLAVMSVITTSLPSILNSIKQFDKINFAKDVALPESDGGSPVCDSPVLPHSHSAAPSGDPISWLPSVWLSSLYSIDNLDPSLLFILRCFNRKHPQELDLLTTAVSTGSKIPQQIQLYHSRETSNFDYNMVVATLSRFLSSCKYDMSAWSSFILSTFIPSEIWNCISKPNFKFSKAGEPEDLWQECIGEVFVTSLEPLLLDVLNIVAYRTKIMPSTDEEVAIEELPCSCRINRFSTPNVKVVMHEALCAVFFHGSIITTTLRPVLFKLTKMLCSKAKLKEDSELPVLKLLIAFFLKRTFMNPNDILKKYYAVTRDSSSRTSGRPTRLPFSDIPEDALFILRKVGDITRLLMMKDVLDVITLPAGAQKFLDEEHEHVDHCLTSLHDQLNISLELTSTLTFVQLQYDVDFISATYPGIFQTYFEMMKEVTDVISKDFSAFLKTVKLLPVAKFNPLEESKSIGGFTFEDVNVKIWNYDRLSEYHTSDLLVRYLPHRWEFTTDLVLPPHILDTVEIMKAFIAKHTTPHSVPFTGDC